MRWLIAVAAALALACVMTSSSAAAAPSPTASATPVHHKSHHKAKRHRVKKVRGQKAPTADRITEIQTALSRDGYYQGEPNGKWDSNTVAAVQKFQSANGMDANGKLDAPTLQKLGLGSDIAGVSAPKPIVPGSAPSSSAPSAAPMPQTSASPRGGPVASAASSPSSSPSSSSQNPPAPTANH